MKILLMCGAGASSGFMAQAMRKAAKEQGLDDIDVIARSEAEMTNNLKGTDIIMFGPHLAYKRDALAKELEQYNIPFAFIDKEALEKWYSDKNYHDMYMASIEHVLEKK